MNSPIGPDRVERLITEMGFDPSHRVLDVGCGTGEFLIRVIEKHGSTGCGVDLDKEKIELARTTAARRLQHNVAEFRVQDAATLETEMPRYDRAMCVGSTHAFRSGESAYECAIDGLMRLVRPGGLILIGEGYWKKPADPDYLALLGDPVGVYRDHAENVLFAETKGLAPLHASVSSDDEWDDFEWAHRRRHEEAAAQRPNDSAAQQALADSRRWRDGYLRWGRSTMGFGFYVFRNR